MTLFGILLDIVYISLSEIQKRYLRYQGLSKNMLSENTEVKAE